MNVNAINTINKKAFVQSSAFNPKQPDYKGSFFGQSVSSSLKANPNYYSPAFQGESFFDNTCYGSYGQVSFPQCRKFNAIA